MTRKYLMIPILAMLGACGAANDSQTTELIQDCPEEQITNHMPAVSETGESIEPNSYFIYKGERRELAEFDLDWIAAHCDVAETEVH